VSSPNRCSSVRHHPGSARPPARTPPRHLPWVRAYQYLGDDAGLPGRSWSEGLPSCGHGVAGGGEGSGALGRERIASLISPYTVRLPWAVDNDHLLMMLSVLVNSL
jgi:hypothetical protein